METELVMKMTTNGERYFKKDCGLCGKDRLCYAIKELGVIGIRGYLCRNCKASHNS